MDKAPDAFRTISEVAEELKVPQHVLRFWESRFREIKPLKRGGGRRYYRPDDIGLLRGIHHLLYGEGYTIRGVQRILRDQGVRFVQAVWQPGAAQPEPDEAAPDDIAEAPIQTENEGEASPRLRPSLIPSNAGDPVRRSEPAAPQFSIAAPAVQRGLSSENVQRLTSVLRDLGECRKLLDAALNEAKP